MQPTLLHRNRALLPPTLQPPTLLRSTQMRTHLSLGQMPSLHGNKLRGVILRMRGKRVISSGTMRDKTSCLQQTLFKAASLRAQRQPQLPHGSVSSLHRPLQKVVSRPPRATLRHSLPPGELQLRPTLWQADALRQAQMQQALPRR